MAEVKTDPNLTCNVCGENNFYLKDGFYYCNECGTKHEHVRAIVIEDDEFDEAGNMKKKMAKTLKIKAPKTEKPQLTSWECYNYILRGLVDELISMGAKDELKPMALQVWAAYLRRTEVAFFNKKHVELPKLGVRFFKRDLKILYNHSQERKNKRKRKSDNGSLKSEESSQRDWRKSKRKLDETQYSINSSRESGTTLYSNNTSSTGSTTRAVIQLKFSSNARRHYKKVMPKKHLAAHEKDAEGLLKCHKMCPNKTSLPRFDVEATSLSVKQIYSILAIALNLIEDDIQLCDLLDFIKEERISKKHVTQYFPDNIAPHCKELLKDISFHLNPNIHSYKKLRYQIGVLARFLNIKEFKMPDIKKLVSRYITELNLPDDVAIYVERLINLLPPKMYTHGPSNYPAYEARAMAYVVFFLKLLFGLDGHKEILISNAARLINVEISKANDAVENKQKKLFVWSDWLEYIEMRKIIISQFNPNFCRKFDQYQDPARWLEELSEELEREKDNEFANGGIKNFSKPIMDNMKRMFEQLHQNYGDTNPDKIETITFSPSFTPSHSYLKRILLHVSKSDKSTVTIPEFMHVDHMEHSMLEYLQPRTLHAFFRKQGKNIKVQKVACTTNRSFVGIFRAPPDAKVLENVLEANFDISEKDWLKQIKKESLNEELEFKANYDNYHIKHIQRMRRKIAAANKKNVEFEFKKPSYNSNNMKNEINPNNTSNIKDNFDILSLHSIDVFNENDMKPIENLNISSPRRRFDGVELWKDVSSDEGSEPEEPYIKPEHTAENKSQTTNNINFLISNLDYWVLCGQLSVLTEVQKKVLEREFPRSFFWLLQTCAQTIGIDWSLLYEQLLIIEVMFTYGIESLDDFQECIKFKPNLEIKDINQIMQVFRTVW